MALFATYWMAPGRWRTGTRRTSNLRPWGCRHPMVGDREARGTRVARSGAPHRPGVCRSMTQDWVDRALHRAPEHHLTEVGRERALRDGRQALEVRTPQHAQARFSASPQTGCTMEGSFTLGSFLARRLGSDRDVDFEMLYVATMLHDIGPARRPRRNQPELSASPGPIPIGRDASQSAVLPWRERLAEALPLDRRAANAETVSLRQCPGAHTSRHRSSSLDAASRIRYGPIRIRQVPARRRCDRADRGNLAAGPQLLRESVARMEASQSAKGQRPEDPCGVSHRARKIQAS